ASIVTRNDRRREWVVTWILSLAARIAAILPTSTPPMSKTTNSVQSFATAAAPISTLPSLCPLWEQIASAAYTRWKEIRARRGHPHWGRGVHRLASVTVAEDG